jgi:transcriptional regulator with XRE-family HTH domain
MAVSTADVRAIVDRICARPDVLDACARRDLGTVISALGSAGITQGQISALTGVPQGRLSEWRTGKREPKGVSTFQKFADGVGLPAAARQSFATGVIVLCPLGHKALSPAGHLRSDSDTHTLTVTAASRETLELLGVLLP